MLPNTGGGSNPPLVGLDEDFWAWLSFHAGADGVSLKLMVALQQVLVVDDGVRAVDHSLSGELAGLGYASVTASLEAADDVLAVIAPPAAVLVQAPTRRNPTYARNAARLRARMRERGIPVILIGESFDGRAGAPVDLAMRLGACVTAKPSF